MATHRTTVAVAAAGSNANVLSGTMWEFAGNRPTLVRAYAVQDGAVAATPCLLTVFLGNAAQCENFPIPAFTAGQGPNRDQHEVGSWLAAPGDRIIGRLQNTDPANASNTRILWDFVPA